MKIGEFLIPLVYDHEDRRQELANEIKIRDV